MACAYVFTCNQRYDNDTQRGEKKKEREEKEEQTNGIKRRRYKTREEKKERKKKMQKYPTNRTGIRTWNNETQPSGEATM